MQKNNYNIIIQQALHDGIRGDWKDHASPVKTLAEITERLKNKKFSGVKKLTLFGSFARGDFDWDSDIDFLIECDKHIDEFDVALTLEKILGCICDVVKMDSLYPWVSNDIFQSPKIEIYHV